MRVLNTLTMMATEVTASDKGVSPTSPNTDYQLLYIVRKHVILTAAIIISTFMCFLGIIMPLGSAVGAGSIDSMINVWCLIMFDKRFNGIYVRIFGCIAKPEWNNANNVHSNRDMNQRGAQSSTKSDGDDDKSSTKETQKSSTMQMVIR